MFLEVLDAHSVVLARGFSCDLCTRLAESVDVVDLGLAERGVTVCPACAGEFDGWCAGRSERDLEPSDFDDVLPAFAAGDQAAE